jgi:hypothetical protein
VWSWLDSLLEVVDAVAVDEDTLSVDDLVSVGLEMVLELVAGLRR